MFNNKTFKVVLFTLIILVSLSMVSWVFWEEEVKYTMPTHKPQNHIDVHIGQKIQLNNYLKNISNKPTFLHFFNPKCPCSKFNMNEFQELVKKYKDQIDFRVVLQHAKQEAVKSFEEKYALDIPILLDPEGEISDICGIYSTPQAVILTSDSEIYYKGNYNKSRFCNEKKTKFAEASLQFLLAGKPLPAFTSEALTPYGCPLPSDKKNK